MQRKANNDDTYVMKNYNANKVCIYDLLKRIIYYYHRPAARYKFFMQKFKLIFQTVPLERKLF